MLACEPALQGLVSPRLVWVPAQPIAKGEVSCFLLSTSHAQMNMMSARPFAWFGEPRVLKIEIAVADEPVAKWRQCRLELLRRLKRLDRNLNIDDRLGRQPRDGCGTDVFDSECSRSQSAPKLAGFGFERLHPACGVRNDLDHGVPRTWVPVMPNV